MSFFENTRKPVGLGGKLMVAMMNLGHGPVARWGLRFLRLAPNAKVLDCGCGGGANIKRLLEKCPHGVVKGIDYSPVSVEKARKLNRVAIQEGRCAVLQGSVADMVFEDSYFDAATAFETVYFWPDLPRCFREVWRVLKPGGTILICNESNGDTDKDERWTQIIGGMTIYKDIELKACLEQAGFHEVQIQKRKSGSASRRGSKGIKHGYFCIHPAHGDRHDGHSGYAGGNYDSFYSLRKKPMKCKIEKNTVQETLILPLYSRKLCTELYPNLYRDETAVRLLDQIDYDFSEAEKNSRSLMQRFGALEVATRQSDLAFEVRDYLKGHPNAAVVNLGCGLDNTGRTCDNGRCKIYNLDFPDVIALRQQLLPAGDREQNIPCDLKDTAWFSKIDASGGAVFFASGVFYYFLTQQVRELVRRMADAFPGGVLVFDAANRTAVKMIAKTWLKTAKIKDVGAYFAVSDAAKEIGTWNSRLQVTSRGYMLGYNNLRDPSVSGFFRFLARVGDNGMKMQIVKIRF